MRKLGPPRAIKGSRRSNRLAIGLNILQGSSLVLIVDTLGNCMVGTLNLVLTDVLHFGGYRWCCFTPAVVRVADSWIGLVV